MSRDLNNRDLRGTPNKMRMRCCRWCRGDWQCLGRKRKRLAKRVMRKKLRLFIKDDTADD